MKTLLTLSAITLSIAGCATMAPPEDRQVVYIENTTTAKTTAYNRALAHFAKTFTDSNHVKMKDEASGQIVAHGNVACSVLKQAGDSNDYDLTFNLDLQVKDNRARIAFEDLQILDRHGVPFKYSYGQIIDKSKAEAVKPCLEPVRAAIAKAINGSDTNW